MTVRKTAKYLYGPKVDSSRWTSMKYKDVLEAKIKLANKNIRHLTLGELTDEVMMNIVASTSAVRFNQDLLQELKEW